ncbi:NAD-dependent isocitrate dehydrogenase [Micromonospora globispora]|uniref:isocitrate/isopropylmalate family dehydrogenase n=1 Tax=Micromonospora globispora TaxID=1450148 RepID=UPI000D70234F|nr:isocitrate/isopropylmalate family dehydrogenase [Micromonospora globispora]PWU55402.1 NAD-dependent isocitrate dehydrogenase [Micromonospora globispora]RQW91801.1 NAD-dependent isocitrate dehydrogenase [Micromonospora globispora]
MTTIGIIPGDGIGPEITEAAIQVLRAAAPGLTYEYLPVGHVAAAGSGDPLPDQVMDRLRELGVVLKAPLEAPKGTGRIVKLRPDGHRVYPSINNAVRRELELYANVRPVHAVPGVGRPGAELDLMLVREVSEGIYSGIEHRIGDVAQAIKIATRPAWERIARFSFELARERGYDRVLLGHKANVLNLTDGLELEVVRTIAADYPDVELQDMMVDALGQAIVRGDVPRSVVLLDNQYGDILSDVAAAVIGSVGLGPGANYGADVAVFEACHGAAPDIAGTGKANPVGLILSGAMLLRHLGDHRAAEAVEAAVRLVLGERRALTPDLGGSATTGDVTAQVVAALDEVDEAVAVRA